MYQRITKTSTEGQWWRPFKENACTKKVIFFLMLICVSINVFAQRVINLNEETAMNFKQVAENVLPEFLKEAKAYRAFAINSALQSANNVSVGDTVNLQLFENKSYTATVSNTVIDVNGNFTIILKLPDYPMGFGYITTSKDNKSLFFVSIPELNQKFMTKNGGNSPAEFLIEINENSVIKLKNDYKEIPVERAIEKENYMEGTLIQENNLNPDTDADPVACTRDVNLTGTDPAVIDIMIVYTPAATVWATDNGTNITNVIAGAMAQTTAVVANQGNGDAINLVYSGQVNYVEANSGYDMSTDLDNLTGTTDGYMDEVHQLRKQYNADIVVLITVAYDYGGLGWVLGNDVRGAYSSAFNIIRVQQASWTTTSIHEIGHNMAMRHEVQQYGESPPTPIYPYAWGWFWTGNNNVQYGSVMSYTGTETPYFSNPDVTHQGQLAGSVTANNAQVFRNTKHVVAFYSNILNNLPTMPTNIIVSNPINNGATVSWDAVPNASTYRVFLPNGSSFWTTSNTFYPINYSTSYQPCNTYNVWVAAVNECGDAVKSLPITFTTKCATDPTVTTLTATSITHNSATLNKTVTANGAAVITQGFKYKTMSAPTWESSTSGNLTGLIPDTQYKFYAYAETAEGTFNGSVLTFTTSTALSCDAPTAVTVPIGNITQTSAVVNWTGSASEYAVEYKISTAPVWTIYSPNPTTNTVTLSSLTPNTTYSVRIKAICGVGNESEYSSTQTFTTQPLVTYAVTVNNGTGGGNYTAGATVTITANAPPAGQQFKKWTTTNAGVTFADSSNSVTTFIMPINAVTVTATYEVIPTYAVTVNNGTGSGNYTAGTTVTITANAPPAGQQFKEWITTSAGVFFADFESATTTFTMPANAVTVTATYEAILYPVTVNSGTGSGNYAAGATVTITANAPPAGQQFKEWQVINGGITLSSTTATTATFTMPANAVEVNAIFEAIPPPHMVMFNSQGTVLNTQTVAHGALANEPLAPILDNHIFDGWFKETECSNIWDFTTDLVTQDTTLYAKWTPETGIAVETDNYPSLQIYPNPAQNEIFIKSDLQIEKVEIYSIIGTLLISDNNFKDKISVSTLAHGVYMLKVYTEKGVTVSKIVKE